MRILSKKPSIDFLSLGRRRVALGDFRDRYRHFDRLVSLATRGLDFGIDFTGGILLEVSYHGSGRSSNRSGRICLPQPV